MVRHTSTVVAVPSQTDTQLSPVGVALSTNALKSLGCLEETGAKSQKNVLIMAT